jgi:hypothetical protein
MRFHLRPAIKPLLLWPLLLLPFAACATALRFDGVDDRVTVAYKPELQIAAGTPLTIELWIRPLSTGQWHALGRRGTCWDSGQSANFQIYGEGASSIQFNSGAAVTWAFGILRLGAWTHVAVVADETGTTIYANGALAGQSASIIGGVTEADLWIGAVGEACAPFPGEIDDVRLWSVARSQADIQASLFTDVDADATGLLASWRFEEAAGSQAVIGDGPLALNGWMGSNSQAETIDPLRVDAPPARTRLDWIFADSFE